MRVGHGVAYRIPHENILLAVDESEAGPKLKDAQAAELSGEAILFRQVAYWTANRSSLIISCEYGFRSSCSRSSCG